MEVRGTRNWTFTSNSKMIAVLKYALLLALLASVSVEASRKIQKVVAQPGRASLVSAKGSAKASAKASLEAPIEALAQGEAKALASEASPEPSTVEQSRLFLQKSTLTITNYLATSSVCTTTLTCATSDAVLTSCRRRRDAVENHIIHDDTISPSEPDAVEVTAAPEWYPTPHLFGLSGSVDEPMEALVSGLGTCVSGRNLGITVLFTTTVTSSTLCQASATETKKFTISGCSPAGITFC